MLALHRDRMVEAAKQFGWTQVEDRLSGPSGLDDLLETLKASVDVSSTSPRRIRVVIDYHGKITVESSATLPLPLRNLYPTKLPPPGTSVPRVSPLTGGALSLGAEDSMSKQGPGYGDPERGQVWTVMVDPVRTHPSQFTSYKTTCRDMYNEARARVGIESMMDPKEVLMIGTKEDEIMEGSLTSILLWREGRWVTPPTSSGGQIGTSRRWLLANGLCVEEVIKGTSLVNGEECWLSNGVRGLIPGIIKL